MWAEQTRVATRALICGVNFPPAYNRAKPSAISQQAHFIEPPGGINLPAGGHNSLLMIEYCERDDRDRRKFLDTGKRIL